MLRPCSPGRRGVLFLQAAKEVLAQLDRPDPRVGTLDDEGTMRPPPELGQLTTCASSLYGERMVTRTCPGERSPTPTFRTKGLDRADKGTILRWRQDGYRLSTFQYEAETLLWKGDEWRLPLPDELDGLLGYPKGYRAVAGATSLQREQLLGNTMHVAAVVRLLEDLKDGTPAPRTDNEDEKNVSAGVQHQVVFVDTSNILQTMWESLREDPFSDVSKDPIEVMEASTEHTKGPWPDVPCPEKRATMPAHFVAPPKSEVESLSTWEYLQVVWDFDSQHARVPWQNSPDVPAPCAQLLQAHAEPRGAVWPMAAGKVGLLANAQ